MLIDWPTVAFQIINFLILVALLKRFLYGRIVQAMETRETHIAAEWAAANEQREASERTRQELDAQTRALEEEKSEILREARHEAEASAN